MNRVGVFIISVLLAGVMVALALPDLPAEAQGGQTLLRFAPPAVGLKPGAQGSVEVRIDNVQGLYGIEFKLAFDPEILKIIDTVPDQEGVQIKPADWWKDGFVAVNRVDNENGRIEFAATLLRPALAVNGNRVVATIPLAARKTGTSSLKVESAILSNRNAEAIPYEQQAGGIWVNESGQVPSVLTGRRSAGPAPGRLALAGVAILAFFAALGGFIFVLQRRR
jgi:Cohesin domain